MSKTVNDKIQSGVKFQTKNGITAIKDGIKVSKVSERLRIKKPDWLRVKIPTGGKYQQVQEIVKSHSLSTVCEESHCPNIGECWSHGTATIMLMGSVCTRACKFCSVDTGNPKGWLDPQEPRNAARSVQLMNLKYVVLTSVDRDDLEDGGGRDDRGHAHEANGERDIPPDRDGLERAERDALNIAVLDKRGHILAGEQRDR